MNPTISYKIVPIHGFELHRTMQEGEKKYTSLVGTFDKIEMAEKFQAELMAMEPAE